MPKYAHSIVACARWEENSIVEWIEYHRSVGFDHFFVYSNDDDPSTLFNVLQPYILGENPIATLTFWPIIGDQLGMYADFLERNKDKTEWACFLDIDEFIVLKNINNISKFIDRFDDDVQCIYFNWLLFGNNGRKVRSDDSILLSLDHRGGLDYHTKTIFRTAKITARIARDGFARTGLPYTHFWTNYDIPEFVEVDVLGQDMSKYGDRFPAEAKTYFNNPDVGDRLLETAYIAHFMFKSEQDFIRRAERGGFEGQKIWKERYKRGEHMEILRQLNSTQDNYLQKYWSEYISQAIEFPVGRQRT